MKFQSLSLLCGTKTCNASCPFCVSKMTGMRSMDTKADDINKRNLLKTLKLADIGGVTSVILTGKGEPTLYPEHINTYLHEIDWNKYQFPFIELQTNASILAMDQYGKYNIEGLLGDWYTMGMTTILISIVHFEPEANRLVYFPKQEKYLDLPAVIKKIKNAGINVRLTCVGLHGNIDNPDKLEQLLDFAALNGVQQVTWRPVTKPTDQTNQDAIAYNWIKQSGMTIEAVANLHNFVEKYGNKIIKLVHGGAIYDYKGHNLCMTNCLTIDPDEETIRQLIYFPNGELYTDWQYKGSRLL